jgi:hypothetical protein
MSVGVCCNTYHYPRVLVYTDKLPQLVSLRNVNVHIIYLIYDGLMLQYAITMRYNYVLMLQCAITMRLMLDSKKNKLNRNF